MIDKIQGNGVYDGYTDPNPKRKNPAVRAYENTPGTKEAAQKKAGRMQQKNMAPPGKDGQGVILDLSPKAAKGKQAGVGRVKSASWADALRKLLEPAIQWLKAFWESDGTKKDVGEKSPGVAESPLSEGEGASGMEPEKDGLGELPPLDADGRVGDFAASDKDRGLPGSLEQMEQMLTQNGTKHLAHNSDLLTYYDRRGKIVEMDVTEKHRVLFGDKNVRKL